MAPGRELVDCFFYKFYMDRDKYGRFVSASSRPPATVNFTKDAPPQLPAVRLRARRSSCTLSELELELPERRHSGEAARMSEVCRKRAKVLGSVLCTAAS
jgi:hypothetical protein